MSVIEYQGFIAIVQPRDIFIGPMTCASFDLRDVPNQVLLAFHNSSYTSCAHRRIIITILKIYANERSKSLDCSAGTEWQTRMF